MSVTTSLNIFVLAVVYFLPVEVNTSQNIWRVERKPGYRKSVDLEVDTVYLHSYGHGRYPLNIFKSAEDSKYCQDALEEKTESLKLSYVEMLYVMPGLDNVFLDSFCARDALDDNNSKQSILYLCQLGDDPLKHIIELNPDDLTCSRIKYLNLPSKPVVATVVGCKSAEGMGLQDNCLKKNGASDFKRLRTRVKWILEHLKNNPKLQKEMLHKETIRYVGSKLDPDLQY